MGLDAHLWLETWIAVEGREDYLDT